MCQNLEILVLFILRFYVSFLYELLYEFEKKKCHLG